MAFGGAIAFTHSFPTPVRPVVLIETAVVGNWGCQMVQLTALTSFDRSWFHGYQTVEQSKVGTHASPLAEITRLISRAQHQRSVLRARWRPFWGRPLPMHLQGSFCPLVTAVARAKHMSSGRLAWDLPALVAWRCCHLSKRGLRRVPCGRDSRQNFRFPAKQFFGLRYIRHKNHLIAFANGELSVV